ncbi:MAG: 5-formyltetrahydrofolate cyclo-ligase [Cytophagales bacterium CG18_big_fil_WC_8_21_14_2_50_42_9]|nr:MAG: 5-formyltetrahydrofolate cyclo-ligase [Cytophagales bacterium CG18_big_fil_WC_8_21_14_2_50_42_9]
MLKATLRKEILQKRLQYTPEEVNAWSRQICNRFFTFFSLAEIKMLHIFLPIIRYNEINTWYIIRKLQQEYPGIALVVPVSNFKELTLGHYLFTTATELAENKWGIPEPRQAEPVAETSIDMILIPLLGFDKQGHRIGYGKGFYDRFLHLCRPGVLKIGLSLAPPLEKITDVHAGDVLLDYAVTPGNVYSFK